MPVHPKYGVYEEGWKQVSVKEQIFENYEINEQCQVRNKITLDIHKPTKKQRVGLWQSRKRYNRHIYMLALCSFFPHINPDQTVDHIDENCHNNDINNLQWLSRSENSSKSNKLRPRNNGPAQSRPVI